MKFGLAYGSFCIGNINNALQFDKLWDSPRGLTGSELSYIRIAQELSNLGHDVTLFTIINPEFNRVLNYDSIEIKNINEINVNEHWDAFCSWNETTPLVNVCPSSLRMVNLQINSIDHCPPGFDDLVDIWLSPSSAHRERMLLDSHLFYKDGFPSFFKFQNVDKWEVLTNGCDVSSFDASSTVSGRVIWASSPDRGLHWLLKCWPMIKEKAPHAHLRIFYKLNEWLNNMESMGYYHPIMGEQVKRAIYIKECLKRLKNSDVEVIGSVSRSRITREMSEAEVLAYSCDTVNWTEGFSVTTMEACASGTVPVVSCVDALGTIYGGLESSVKAPVSKNLNDFTEKVVRALTDDNFRFKVVKQAMELSMQYQWSDIAKEFVSIVERRK